MQYSPKESGTGSHNARQCFASFGYDQNPLRAYNYTDIRTELNTGRPLWMCGEADIVDSEGNTNRKGHAWVLDGYKCRTHYIKEYVDCDYGREYFRNDAISCQYVHINWGHDGANDGYFESGVFDLAHAYEYDSDFNYIKTVYDYDLQIMTGIWNSK